MKSTTVTWGVVALAASTALLTGCSGSGSASSSSSTSAASPAVASSTAAKAATSASAAPSTAATSAKATASAASSAASGSASAGALTMATVKTHNTASSCWSVIDGNVYDLTAWINAHPGGASRITALCGIDGTNQFKAEHGTEAGPNAKLATFLKGKLQG